MDELEWIKTIEGPGAEVRDKDIHPMLSKWIRVHQLRRILDVGCGQGSVARAIDLDGVDYVGVDPSSVLLTRARELSALDFRMARAEALPFQNQEFDGVFSVAVWHLLEDIIMAAKEMARILRPKGKFFLILANPDRYELWTDPEVKKRTHEEIDRALFSAGLVKITKTSFRDGLWLSIEGETP